MLPPVVVLQTMRDVRDAIDGEARDFWAPEHKWRVRSLWLGELIEEIVACGEYPYNATVKKLAWERLGFSPLSEDDAHREGDTLSLFIYNANRYRRDDEARAKDAGEAAEGWIRPTPDWLESRIGKRVEVLVPGEQPVKVKVVELDQGRGPAIRPPYTRRQVYVLNRIKVREVG